MRLPHKTLEKKLLGDNYRYVIGVDEVGMGCLAGPVVVCAIRFGKKFFLKKHKNLHWLRDSKLLSPKKREVFVNQLLKERGLKYQISYCRPKTIDRLNIYQAARFAMRCAIHKLAYSNNQKLKSLNAKRYPLNAIILVDGKNKIAGLDLPQLAIVKGDRKVFSIACASIIAKVTRDKMMKKYAKKFPNYGFERHKGYATKLHRAQLVACGPCRIHRRSFARLSFWTEKNNQPWLSSKI